MALISPIRPPPPPPLPPDEDDDFGAGTAPSSSSWIHKTDPDTMFKGFGPLITNSK